MDKPTLHPADLAIAKKPNDRTNEEWASLLGIVRNAVDCVIASNSNYRCHNLSQHAADITQDIMLNLVKGKHHQNYDIAKTPKHYYPRCWGHFTLIANGYVANYVKFLTRKCRDVRQEISIDEAGFDVTTDGELIYFEPKDTLDN